MSTQIKNQHTQNAFITAWAIGLVFYFIAYATRSTPSVMTQQFSDLYGVAPQRALEIFGAYYYTYSICALLAGICLDKFGARRSMFAGTLVLGIGCALFILASEATGVTGRMLQGAASAFAFPGCIFLATRGFSQKTQATAIGITQCVGMFGGFAGQSFMPLIMSLGVEFKTVWLALSALCFIPAVLMLLIIPRPTPEDAARRKQMPILEPLKIIFSNPQSWLTGAISGLMFAPTTVFVMTWAVGYFVTDLGFTKELAARTAAMASLGWVAGAPLMGFISDRIGKRKPVIFGALIGMALMIVQGMLAPNLLPPKLTMFLFGVFSGSAMVPYSIIKEVNPKNVIGSASGVQNFITFGVTSIIGPLFAKTLGSQLATVTDLHEHFQRSLMFWVFCIALAFILTFFLEETHGNQREE